MAIVVRRLLSFLCGLAFLVTATVQVLPCHTATAATVVSVETNGGCAGSRPPCSTPMPNCVDQVGCVTMSALPASVPLAVAFGRTSPGYDLAPEALPGISVEPELSPPILAA